MKPKIIGIFRKDGYLDVVSIRTNGKFKVECYKLQETYIDEPIEGCDGNYYDSNGYVEIKTR